MANLKRITVRNVMGKTAIPKDADSLQLISIVGVVRSVRVNQSTFAKEYRGDFAAMNMLSGETFRAPKAYLPTTISDGIEKFGKMPSKFAAVISLTKPNKLTVSMTEEVSASDQLQELMHKHLVKPMVKPHTPAKK